VARSKGMKEVAFAFLFLNGQISGVSAAVAEPMFKNPLGPTEFTIKSADGSSSTVTLNNVEESIWMSMNYGPGFQLTQQTYGGSTHDQRFEMLANPLPYNISAQLFYADATGRSLADPVTYCDPTKWPGIGNYAGMIAVTTAFQMFLCGGICARACCFEKFHEAGLAGMIALTPENYAQMMGAAVCKDDEFDDGSVKATMGFVDGRYAMSWLVPLLTPNTTVTVRWTNAGNQWAYYNKKTTPLYYMNAALYFIVIILSLVTLYFGRRRMNITVIVAVVFQLIEAGGCFWRFQSVYHLVHSGGHEGTEDGIPGTTSIITGNFLEFVFAPFQTGSSIIVLGVAGSPSKETTQQNCAENRCYLGR